VQLLCVKTLLSAYHRIQTHRTTATGLLFLAESISWIW